jgi:hypothetical protein
MRRRTMTETKTVTYPNISAVDAIEDIETIAGHLAAAGYTVFVENLRQDVEALRAALAIDA